MELNASEKIKLIARRKKIKYEDLAAGLGCSRQNLAQRMARDSWNASELASLAALIGCRYDPRFIDLDTGEEF